MFTKSARFYDVLYAFKDYAAAADRVRALIEKHVPGARSILDVGCGTGSHIGRLSKHYRVEGLDISEDLIAVAREKSPHIPFHVGDMVDFDLGGRSFDVICCLFSAIAYVQQYDRMARAVACMAQHLNIGGMIMIEPWFDEEQYWTDTITMNQASRGDDLKIAWMYTSSKEGQVSVLDVHYLVGTPERIDHFTEVHRMGLFSQEEYRTAIEHSGLGRIIYDPKGLFQRGLYLAFK